MRSFLVHTKISVTGIARSQPCCGLKSMRGRGERRREKAPPLRLTTTANNLSHGRRGSDGGHSGGRGRIGIVVDSRGSLRRGRRGRPFDGLTPERATGSQNADAEKSSAKCRDNRNLHDRSPYRLLANVPAQRAVPRGRPQRGRCGGSSRSASATPAVTGRCVFETTH